MLTGLEHERAPAADRMPGLRQANSSDRALGIKARPALAGIGLERQSGICRQTRTVEPTSDDRAAEGAAPLLERLLLGRATTSPAPKSYALGTRKTAGFLAAGQHRQANEVHGVMLLPSEASVRQSEPRKCP